MKLNKELQVKLGIFQKDKRAYFSFLVLAFLFIATLPAELICNVRPIMIIVEGKPFFPILINYNEKDFGGSLPSEPDYKSARFLRLLKGLPEPSSTVSLVDDKNSFGLQLDDFEDEDEEPGFSIELGDFENSPIVPPTETVKSLSAARPPSAPDKDVPNTSNWKPAIS